MGMRDLSRNTSRVVQDVARTGRPALVTVHGRPLAALVPIDAAEIEDFILANAPEFIASMREAEADLAAGLTRPASELFDELDKDHP
ncbi:MAG: type II toxin-antitoxin system prevent-host-death family antitoxin [Candidatus Dormibacteraeota bacterium]|nr:type II toxin-antitoxin system prevent-host-death family antitoxin [Candidatus Dormibacteraeota bacterium]